MYIDIVSDIKTGGASVLDIGTLLSVSPREAIEQIWKAWQEGDNYVRAMTEQVFERFGWAVGMVMNLLDPDVFTFGGYFFSGRKEWMREVCRRSERWIFKLATRNTRFELGKIVFEDELRIAAVNFYFYMGGKTNAISENSA